MNQNKVTIVTSPWWMYRKRDSRGEIQQFYDSDNPVLNQRSRLSPEKGRVGSCSLIKWCFVLSLIGVALSPYC